MCEAIGHPVDTLTRVRFGPLADARLKPGRFRDLTPQELHRLRAALETKNRKPKPTTQDTD
jgi:23S rRNA pseudouridine2605 synthase